MDADTNGVKMGNEYIKLFWPEIMYASFERGYATKTGIDFVDNDEYWGLKYE